MKITGRVLFTLLAAFLGLLAVNIFNIFDYWLFIPEDYRYEVGITIYFAIADTTLTNTVDWIKENYYSRISCIMKVKGMKSNIFSTPEVDFNELDLAEVFLHIHVKGKKKSLSDVFIQIPSLAVASMQLNTRNTFATIIKDGSCIVKIGQLFGNVENQTEVEVEIPITFIKEPVDISSSIQITPKISRTSTNRVGSLMRTLATHYSSNSFILKTKGR